MLYLSVLDYRSDAESLRYAYEMEKDEKMITFDANHEMAGKELNFRIELVEVK